MRILLSLTYYLPHVSGVTVYTARLAKALAAAGHQVTVITSRFRKDLPPDEVLDGVRVVRLPVWFWISKGAIMPAFAARFYRLARQHDVVVMYVPNTPLEAFAGPLIARWTGTPLVAMHMCDVQLPPGLFNSLISRGVAAASLFACTMSDGVISMTGDYARNSPVLRRVVGKVVAIRPPIEMARVTPEAARAWRESRSVGEGPLIGFAARFATEKGVEVMLKALPKIWHEFPGARVLFAGEHIRVFGEKDYKKRLRPLLNENNGHWTFLGVLAQEELPLFYGACDVTVLPSLNRTESFGLVQAESMICGTPVVSSDLPGVRECVRRTGMGRIARVGDEDDLASAVREVIRRRADYVRPRVLIERMFSPDRARRRYEEVLSKVKDAREIVWIHLREKPWFLALLRSVEHELVHQAGPFDRPILDVGCGDGHFGPVALGCPIDVGVDADLRAVGESSRRRFGGQAAYGNVIQCPATKLPLPDNRFATTLCNSTAEHIQDLDGALREMCRVLRLGGRLILTVPTDRWEKDLVVASWLRRAGLKSLGDRYERWFRAKQRHYHLLPAEEWTARVEAAGLRVVAKRRYFSAAATAWLELLHYEGWHNLIVKAVTGRWVLWRWRPLFCVPEAVVSRFMGLRERDSDSCLYLEATKAEDVH